MRHLRKLTALLLTWLLLPLAVPLHAADVVEYYHTDGIGNVRVVTDATGAVIERHDYLPFGEEWCGTAVCGANRTPGQPLRFTGKERDAETGLDYFGARYYRANAGRFTTVDPVMNAEAGFADPQRWNRYAYASNNPLRYLDPDGRDVIYATPGLQARYDAIGVQSVTHRDEMAAAAADKNLMVQILPRGLRQNDERSSGDATISFHPDATTTVRVYVDQYRTSDGVIIHETGHIMDARTNRAELLQDGARNKKNKGGPGEVTHNERPEEKRAEKFKERVERERKEFRRQEKEVRRREKEKQ